MNKWTRYGTFATLGLLLAITGAAPSEARGGGKGGGNVRSSGQRSVNSNVNRGGGNRNTNVNRNNNVNVNRNNNVNINNNRHVDVDVDVNHRGGYYGGGCCYHDNYHPVATAVAVTAAVAVTSAVIGSIVYSVPPNCTTVVVNGFGYRQCGSTWYQPQISGSSTTYIVVNAPR
jgi:hypothetical protein